MSEENIYGTSPLEDFEYTSSEPRKGMPTGVAAPVLDDMEFEDYSARKGMPTGVSAPILDDMDEYSFSSAKKGAPTGVSAPVLDEIDDYSSYSKKGNPTGVTASVLDENGYNPEPNKLIMTDEEVIAGLTPEQKVMFEGLPQDKQQQVIEMRRTQLGAEAPPPVITAPVLDEDNYTPPPKKEEPPQPAENITAPVLDEEPETPEYVSKYANRDLEKIKEEAKKTAVTSSLVSHQKDEKESLRMMMELKEQQRQELARKGFKISIVLAILGLVASVAFYLLYTGQLGLDYKEGLSGIGKTVSEASMYIATISGLSSLLLVTGVGGLKSLCSFVYFIFGALQIFPGVVMIPQHEGSMAKIVILYLVSLGCTLGVFITLSASEAISAFYKKAAVSKY